MIKSLLCFTAVVAMATCLPAEMQETRHLLQFSEMVICTTGESLLSLLFSYNGYGCYCGLGGSGAAVDPTDQCCKAHDTCYETSKDHGCWGLDKYLADYKFDAKRKISTDPSTCEITCKSADEYSFWALNEDCKAWMCECDRTAALCFAQHRGTYDAQYEGWSQC